MNIINIVLILLLVVGLLVLFAYTLLMIFITIEKFFVRIKNFLKNPRKREKESQVSSWYETRNSTLTMEKITGEEGELEVSEALKNANFGAGNPVLINDFRFRNNRGNSVQIDHLLISRKGIFVLETKNWNASEISGSLDSEEWEVTYRDGSSFWVMNPYIQNSNHIKNLTEKVRSISDRRVYNIVVLAGKGFYKDLRSSSMYVTTLEYLPSKINKYQEIYSDEEVRFFKNSILSVYENISDEEHLRNIELYKKWKEESRS